MSDCSQTSEERLPSCFVKMTLTYILQKSRKMLVIKTHSVILQALIKSLFKFKLEKKN